MQQDIYRWGRIVLVMLTVFLGVLTVGMLKKLGTPEPASNAITVSGQGEASAVPDIATFTATVSADATSVTDAQGKVTEKINAILAAMKNLGIEEKDIKTADYSVSPKYTYSQGVCTMQYPNNCPPGRQVQDGYTASESLTVKVRKTDVAGQALAAAGSAGASNLSGISFTMDDPERVSEEARAEAIANAKTRAQALAKELGVHLVRVVSYSDSTQGGPMPLYNQVYGAGVMDAKASAPNLPVGENKVRISVSLTYEIR